MKLSIKNLKGEVFTVEVEPSDNIAGLKAKIHEAKGLPAESLKIVYKGKTVNDADEIEKLGIKETDFLVVMTQVQKPAPKPQVEGPAKVEVPAEKSEGKPASKPVTKPAVQQPQASQENEQQIIGLMSMGFPREKCVEALRAAFNNEERAVEYLLNGIPANLQRRAQQAPRQSSEPTGLAAGGVAALSAIVNNPQFAQIRNLLRSNPAALQPVLSRIASTSPEIYQLITEHPEEFERLILEGAEDVQPGQAPPGTIMISPEDHEAINRLRQLGFSEIESAQAYFACDKNEDLAANLLFDRLANGDIEMEAPRPAKKEGEKKEEGKKEGDDSGDDDNLFN